MMSKYIYDVGYAFRGLQRSVSRLRTNPKHVNEWLDYFKQVIKPFKCHNIISNQIDKLIIKVQEFEENIDKLSDDEKLLFSYGYDKSTSKFDKVHPKEADLNALFATLEIRMEMWEGTIEEEVKQYEIIQFRENTLLNSKKLKLGAEAFLPKDIWKKLSDFQKQDMQEAVFCLLYGLWTASGMVSMRTAESALAKYYEELTGKTNQSWGVMLNDLKKEQNADTKLIGYMDFLKDIRNNLQHPNERIDDRKAEQTLFHTIYVLEIIYS